MRSAIWTTPKPPSSTASSPPRTVNMASSRLRFVSFTPPPSSVSHTSNQRATLVAVYTYNSAAPPRRLSRGPGRRDYSLAMGGYEAHGLLTGARVSGVDAAHGAGNGNAPRLLYPPHRHAQVFGLHDKDGAPGAQPLVDGLGDLGREALLELGATGVTLHQSGQLGQTYDLPVWYVAHVGLADEGHEVMFAE